MSIIWGTLAGLLLYLEIVYHLSGFGWSGCNPIYTIMLILAWSGIQTKLVRVVKTRFKNLLYYSFIWFAVVWTGVQLVYLRIFKQPMLWEAVFRGGGDALTNYWREALDGVLGALPFLLLLVLPAVVIGIVIHRTGWQMPQFTGLQILRTIVIVVAGSAGCVVTLEVGKAMEADFYEDYEEFFDPLGVVETMGVLPTLQRDTAYCADMLIKNLFGIDTKPIETLQQPDSTLETESNAVSTSESSSAVSGNLTEETKPEMTEQGKTEQGETVK